MPTLSPERLQQQYLSGGTRRSLPPPPPRLSTILPPPPPPPPLVSRTNEEESRGSQEEERNDVSETVYAMTVSSSSRALVEHRVSRFQFQSDTRAPPELAHLEAETLRKRVEFRSRMHELETRAALWKAQLATETMDRDTNLAALDVSLQTSLEDAVNRTFLHVDSQISIRILGDTTPSELIHTDAIDESDTDETKDGSEEETLRPNSSLPILERKLATLQTGLLRDVNLTVANQMKQELHQEVAVPLEACAAQSDLERTKAQGREGSMVRRLESLAARVARNVAEESAVRHAQMSMVEHGVDHSLSEDRLVELQRQVSDLRERLATERAERQRQDKLILNRIVETQKALQRTVLVTVDDTIDSTALTTTNS